MTITVTQAHITNGVANDCDCCPVAHALLDATGISWAVSCKDIERIVVDMHCSCRTIRVPAPRSVARFVRRFDRGDPVRPFSFRFNPPS